MSTMPFTWPAGKRCAVSLTFDDARLSQIDRGVPLLNRLGARASFYVSFETLEQRLPAWRQAVADGHEIGNHTTCHPCSGNFPFARTVALEEYSIARMTAELAESNARIHALVGVTPQTFAYPCGQKFVGRGAQLQSYVPVVARQFLAGRGFRDEWHNDPAFCDLAQLFGVDADQAPLADLLALVERCRGAGGWLVLAGHEIADEARQSVTAATLEAFCRHCLAPASGIWLDTVATIAHHVQAQQAH